MYEGNLHHSIFRYFVRMTSSVSLLRKWIISGLIAFFAAVLGLLPAVSASAVGNLDQQATGTSTRWYYIMNGMSLGQVFTAGVSGQFDRFTIDGYSLSNPSAPLVANVYTADGSGFPTGASLATASVSQTAIPGTVSTIVMDFSSPATITAAVKYVVILSTSGSGEYHFEDATNVPSGSWAIKPLNASWQAYVNNGETSFRFATYVTPVASPSSSSSSTPDPSLVHTGINEVQSYQYLGLGAVLLLTGAVVINIARVRSRQD